MNWFWWMSASLFLNKIKNQWSRSRRWRINFPLINSITPFNSRQTLWKAKSVRFISLSIRRHLRIPCGWRLQMHLPWWIQRSHLRRRHRRVQKESMQERRHVRQHPRILPVSHHYIFPFLLIKPSTHVSKVTRTRDFLINISSLLKSELISAEDNFGADKISKRALIWKVWTNAKERNISSTAWWLIWQIVDAINHTDGHLQLVNGQRWRRCST